MALDPLQSDLLYAGSQEGLYKSSDGGQSWSAANSDLSGGSISSLVIDPGQPAILYAGTEVGIFKSSDRGSSWSTASSVVDMGAFELPIACPASSAARLYVNGSVDGGGSSGLDWNNALRELSHAFALTEGCPESEISEIWVAAGKYLPGDGSSAAVGAQDTSFKLSSNLAVYGGFTGTEFILAERDWLENWTILSGDIESDDLVDARGLVTETMKIVGSNSYHVVTSTGNDATAVLDGFIINGGQANGEADMGHDSGGAIYNDASSPTLRHLTILANMADDGGGIANVFSSNPALSNVRIEANSATHFGGGVFNQSSSPRLTNVALFDNRATSGGGMFNAISNPQLINATFAGNRSDSQQVTAGNNQSKENGCESQTAGCRLQDLGGTAGTAGSGGGMFNLNNSRPLITNSIFWQNQDDNGTGTASAAIGNDAGSIPLISYSLVQASGGSGPGWNGVMGFDQGQNIDEDPLFFAAEDRHLLPGSPAVDAGANAANNSEHDLDVKPRISDGTNDGEAVIDLGVYETTLVAITISSTPNSTTAKVGDMITFAYLVINDGEVSLNEIEAVDDKLGEVTLDANSLAPGESANGALSYVLQEDDIGTLVATVTVTAKSAAGAIVSAQDTVAVEVKPGVYRSFVPVLMKGR